MPYNNPPVNAMGVFAKWVVVIVALGAIGTLGYLLIADQADKSPRLPELLTPAALQQSVPDAQPQERPVYDEPVQDTIPQPLPDLNDSDATVLAALKSLNINGLVEMMIPQDMLRKFVRAVDVVEEGKIVRDYRPIASPQGTFVADTFSVKVSGGELGEQQEVEQFRVSPKNYLRYTLFVQVLSGLESDAAITLYKRYYPLLNRAHQELGSNKGNFHSVLIRAIDKTLSAPDAHGDVLLVHPKIYYEFADPALEKLPEVHKLMLRMGPDNAEKVKISLRNIRAKLLQK
jgi:hypothetical protein